MVICCDGFLRVHKFEKDIKSRFPKKESESVGRSEFSIQEFFRCRQVAQTAWETEKKVTEYYRITK